jgi:Tol biopolymer transport system component
MHQWNVLSERDGRAHGGDVARGGGAHLLNLYSQAADGTGAAERLTTCANTQYGTSISPDDTRLVGSDASRQVVQSLFMVHLTGSAARPRTGAARRLEPVVEQLLAGQFWWAEISPDGRYVADESRESGRSEVWVHPFPNVNGGRWQITSDGGTRVAWARNSRELFYIDRAGALTSVPVETSGPTFVFGRPSRVFDVVYPPPSPNRHYDVSPDGHGS